MCVYVRLLTIDGGFFLSVTDVKLCSHGNYKTSNCADVNFRE